MVVPPLELDVVVVCVKADKDTAATAMASITRLPFFIIVFIGNSEDLYLPQFRLKIVSVISVKYMHDILWQHYLS